MFFFRTKTIKQKIIIGTTINCTFALLLAFVSIVSFEYFNYRTQAENDYRILTKILESTNRSAVGSHDGEKVTTKTNSILKLKPEVIAACVYLPDGTILSQYSRSVKEMITFPLAQSTEVIQFQKNWIDIFHPIRAADNKTLLGIQFMRVDNHAFHKEISDYIALFMIIFPLPIAIAIFLALYLQASMAQPLTELREVARQISQDKNFNVLIKSLTDDEIGFTMGEFNAMVRELKKHDTHQNRFARVLEEKINDRVSELKKEITRRKKAEKRERKLQNQLDRSRRMESLGILAGGVAHDLNNILGPVVAYPDLILSQLPENSPYRKDLEAIHNSAMRAAAVIQDLLTLARRGNYQLQVISVKDLLESYLHSPEFIEKQMLHNAVKVETDIAANTPGIKGSEVHLRQVLMNLTLNAMEAMPDGGTLKIASKACWIKKTTPVYSGVLRKGQYTQLQVIDTGEGIRKQDADSIFEPFYTNKQMGKSGTGLGLAIVYGIVADLKGFIDLKSEPGVGTEFSLYFPATRRLVTQHSKHRTVPKGDERILIVDDDAEQRALAKKLLTHLGYEVFSTSSGRKAQRVVHNNDFDLIVMDMILEDEMDGLDSIEAILKQKPQQRFVIASGYSESERAKKAQKLTDAPYLTKPYSLNEIAHAIRSVLDKKSKVLL